MMNELKVGHINIRFEKSIPDHVIIMIKNMAEYDQKDALDIIKGMMEKGDIIAGKYSSRPPMIQNVDNDKVSCHLPHYRGRY